MRTAAEIKAMVSNLQRHPLQGPFADVFGTVRKDLTCSLPYEDALPSMNPGTTPEAWGEVPDEAGVIGTIHEYMEFAWGKANDRRGLSAARSIQHMQAWLWLLGVADEPIKALENYTAFGKPELRVICEAFGWNWRTLDDGVWTSGLTTDGEPVETTAAPEASRVIPGLEPGALAGMMKDALDKRAAEDAKG